MEDDWNGEEEEISNLIPLEEPSACHLPCTVRFRAFSDAAAREESWGPALPHNLCVVRRRRLDDVARPEGDAVVRPLLRVLRDPLARSRRQLETLRWLDGPRAADEIVARFELDRKLGAAPSLAAVHRALKCLRAMKCGRTIADMAEDLVMDAASISVHTLLEIVEGLKKEPQRAASLLFSLTPLVKNGTVPTSVWSSLCCELDDVARQMSAPLERSVVELFGQLLYCVRNDGPVDGAIVVYYGQALLKSRAPIQSIVGFVQSELLSGRNTPPSLALSELRLSAFLSDLIQVISGYPNSGMDEREEGPPFSVKERLLCCSDLVKHAYANRLPLNPTAFDVLLRFCDQQQEYNLLCIHFLAMCTLSTPSLLSATRVTEIFCDVEELSRHFARIIGQPIPLLILYIICRHGKSSLFSSDGRKAKKNRELLELHFCRCLARLCARDGTASHCMNAFAAIAEFGNPAGAHAFICALINVMRMPQHFFGGSLTRMDLEALESFNLETLYYALLPTDVTLADFQAFIQQRRSSFLFPSLKHSDGGGVTLEGALTILLESPQVYSTVLDVSAVCALAESSALAEAFAKMMDGYVAKSGAFAFIDFEVCVSSQLTCGGRQLLLSWLDKHNWLILLPLSLTVQLLTGITSSAMLTSASFQPPTSHPKQQQRKQQRSCILLFHAMRRVGHTRVAFVTAAQKEAEEAKAEDVNPVIMLEDLKVRLGIR